MKNNKKNTARFGIVPDSVLENKKLSLGARAVAAWLVGRQSNFVIKVEPLRTRFLGITEKQWRSIRKELEESEMWRSTKKKNKAGVLSWHHEFSATGLPACQETINPTPPSCMDGQCTDSNCMHETTTRAREYVYQNEQDQEFTVNTSSTCEPIIEEMVAAAVWARKKTSGLINESGYKFAIRKRLQKKNGISQEDRETHNCWMLHQKAVQKNAESIAAAKKPPEEINLPGADELKTAWEAFRKSQTFKRPISENYPDACSEEMNRFKVFLFTGWKKLKGE